MSMHEIGGARRDRTADLLHAMQALSQLSYGPPGWKVGKFRGFRRRASSAVGDSRTGGSVASQRGDAVALLGKVMQPLPQEGIHPQAMPDHFGRRRIHADHVLPAASDVAMRGFDLARIAVQAQVRGGI